MSKIYAICLHYTTYYIFSIAKDTNVSRLDISISTSQTANSQ